MTKIAAVNFIHFDREYHKGDEVPDDDPLVALAPHLFADPKPPAKKAKPKSPKKARP